MNRIAVIIVIYKDSNKRIKFLFHAINKLGIPKKSIFIRDNSDDNIGYAAAINEIVKKQLLNFDFFFIINPDITLENHCISMLLSTMKLDSSIGIVGPRTFNKKNVFFDGGDVDKKRFSSKIVLSHGKQIGADNLREVTYVSGSAMFIRAELFKTIGLFKEDYFIYYEELDFCFRAKKAGYRLVIDPRAKIFHSESETVGKTSPAMNYYMARNHLLFLERFAPWYIKLHELLRLPKTLVEARKNKSELLGIRDYFFRIFGRNRKIKNKVDL